LFLIFDKKYFCYILLNIIYFNIKIIMITNIDTKETISNKVVYYKITDSNFNNNVLVDFGKNWIWKEEFEEYLSVKNSL